MSYKMHKVLPNEILRDILSTYCSAYSSTLLVLMSFEKCFAVYFPLMSKTVCPVKTAKWVTGIAGALLASYNSLHFLN